MFDNNIVFCGKEAEPFFRHGCWAKIGFVSLSWLRDCSADANEMTVVHGMRYMTVRFGYRLFPFPSCFWQSIFWKKISFLVESFLTDCILIWLNLCLLLFHERARYSVPSNKPGLFLLMFWGLLRSTDHVNKK